MPCVSGACSRRNVEFQPALALPLGVYNLKPYQIRYLYSTLQKTETHPPRLGDSCAAVVVATVGEADGVWRIGLLAGRSSHLTANGMAPCIIMRPSASRLRAAGRR